MNKAEKAALEAALEKAAFHRTAPVMPDVPPPEGGGRYTTTGWLFSGQRSDFPRVEQAWSTCIAHGYGDPEGMGGSQGARWLYSTRERAIAALRYEVEQECTRRLRRIDRMMAE